MKQKLLFVVNLCESYNKDPTDDQGLKRLQEVIQRLHTVFLSHPSFGQGGRISTVVLTLLAVLVIIEMIAGVKDKQTKLQYFLKELWEIG